MGRNRYYYDRRGNLKGYSSDNPPEPGCGAWIVLIIIVFLLLKGCGM